ncbi:hypothetical protein K440DRAFT_645679 [Wilcoxina mikolae CBS 423.85]|nr:hypothetical protein K440DRAFT_645679 [Wilcoxina mikolae CBS 423.85]
MDSWRRCKVQGKGEFGHPKNRDSRQIELLLDSRYVLRIVTGDLKKLEDLGYNATAAERWVHATLTEFDIDKHGTTRSILLLAMKERLQLEYMKVKNAKELWVQLTVEYKSKVKRSKFHIPRKLVQVHLDDCGDVTTYTLRIDRLVQDWKLCVDADEVYMADNDKPAVRKCK